MKCQARIAAGTCEAVVSREDHAIGWQSTIIATGAIVRYRDEQGSGMASTAIGTTAACRGQRLRARRTTLRVSGTASSASSAAFSCARNTFSFLPNKLSSQPTILPCSLTDREMCGTTFASK
jgi:hypothetical protein